MPIPFETLEAEALRLPSAERARLLDRIVESLDQDAARDEAWDAVAARRDAEAAEGAADVVVPLDEALERLRAEIR